MENASFGTPTLEVVGSNPVSRTKNPVSHQGYRVFELSQRDSKGAVSENVPVARFPRDPARPQAGNPVRCAKGTAAK